MKKNKDTPVNPSLIINISQLIESSRQAIRHQVNSTMILCYWEIGRLIIEEEQKGAVRAQYGKKQLEQISNDLKQRCNYSPPPKKPQPNPA